MNAFPVFLVLAAAAALPLIGSAQPAGDPLPDPVYRVAVEAFAFEVAEESWGRFPDINQGGGELPEGFDYSDWAGQQGVDVLAAPRFTVLSGRAAEVVVGQELSYPTHYQIAPDGQAVPADFETRVVGVELSATPTYDPEDDTIALAFVFQITELEGFVEYHEGQPGIVTEARDLPGPESPTPFIQPIFSTRRAASTLTLPSGAARLVGVHESETDGVSKRLYFILRATLAEEGRSNPS